MVLPDLSWMATAVKKSHVPCSPMCGKKSVTSKAPSTRERANLPEYHRAISSVFPSATRLARHGRSKG